MGDNDAGSPARPVLPGDVTPPVLPVEEVPPPVPVHSGEVTPPVIPPVGEGLLPVPELLPPPSGLTDEQRSRVH